MEVIVGGRRSGKTTYLIDRLKKERALYLVVDNNQTRRWLLQRQPNLKDRILTTEEAIDQDRGRSFGKEYVIDNLDIVIADLLHLGPRSRIEAVTMTGHVTRLIGGPRDPRTGI